MLPLQRPVLLLALAAPALADVNFPSFSSTAGLSLVGSAARSGSVLRLTPFASDRVGAAWFVTPQNVVEPFVCEFTFQLGGSADGMAFVIQGQGTTAVGSNGGGLGYDGITNSIAIELDTYLNGSDPSENHLSVNTRGTAANSSDHGSSLGSTSLLVNLNDGAVHTLRAEYVPGVLRIQVDGAAPTLQVDLDIAATLSLTGGQAWVGFTAATGGLAQSHDVRSWTFDAQASIATGNGAPDAPVVLAPDSSSAPVDPAAATFLLGPYFDPDGDAHLATDYELWRAQPTELVWRLGGATGAERLTAPLSSGTFLGSHAGQTGLDPFTAYVARARVRDDSGDPFSEWSPWTERDVLTGDPGNIVPLVVSDLQVLPAPTLRYAASGRPVELAAGAGGPRAVFETAGGDVLLEFVGDAAAGNRAVDGVGLAQGEPLRLRVDGGTPGLALNPTEVVIRDEVCAGVRVMLPTLDVAPGASAYYWLSADGGTWEGAAAQTAPTFALPGRGPAFGWDAQPGYQVDVLATGFQLPVNLAFVPNPGPAPGDPFLYFTELYGRILVMTNDGSVSVFADNLLNYNPLGSFPGAGEQGLGGLAVDPWSGDVWLSLLYDAGGPHYPRVERLTSADGGLTAATRTTVLDMPGEPQGQAHYVSHLEFLTDGTLLVHMGDGFQTNTARNLESYRGKILRIQQDGTPPTDNPYYNGGAVTARDYVYALGVRNPYGGRTRAADGQHYFVENGPGVDRFAKLVNGRDYLWTGSDASMGNFALHNWSPAVGPVNLAWVQPTTFGGSGFPADKWDHGFVSEAGETYSLGPGARGKRITEYVLDAQGNLVTGPVDFVRYTGAGRSTVVGLAAGPEGLYFTDLYPESGSNPLVAGANLLRVRPVPDASTDCGSLGSAYCGPAVANSSGGPAFLRATGSDVVLDNDLTLEGRGLPANTFAMLVASRTQGLVPNAGGSSGVLCLGGTLGRFNAIVAASGPAGAVDFPVDLGQMPPPLSAVAAGDTWNFQVWFRDFSLFPTSNFTDGRSVTFR